MMGILFAVIILAVVGTNFNHGVWSNALRFVCTVTAALIATNFFEPLGGLMEKNLPSIWHFTDFLALWLIFSAANFGLYYLSMKASFTNVRFAKTLDQAGGVLLSAATGWVLVCFTAMTLHLAPLPRQAFFGSFSAEQPMFYGLYPDRAWLGFVHKVSGGAYNGGRTFDPEATFLVRAAAKRDLFDRVDSAFTSRSESGS